MDRDEIVGKKNLLYTTTMRQLSAASSKPLFVDDILLTPFSINTLTVFLSPLQILKVKVVNMALGSTMPCAGLGGSSAVDSPTLPWCRWIW